MEIKKFNEYTPEEQKELLIHWFVYYGKELFTQEDLKMFEGFIKTNAPELFTMAVVRYVSTVQGGFSFPLACMRQGNLNLLFEELPHFPLLETEVFSIFEQLVVTELVTTYLKANPDDPMDARTMEQQAEAIRADQKLRKTKKMH